MLGRRGFITGLISLVAAPAIVRVGSLMPVKMVDLEYGRRIMQPDWSWVVEANALIDDMPFRRAN